VIPAATYKSDHVHVMPLVPQAVQILNWVLTYHCPIDRKPQPDGEWTPKLVSSLDNENLPKEKDTVADGLYVIQLEPEWSIYRLEISD
jgi:hypothetical protein